MAGIDESEYRKRLDDLSAIFTDIAVRAGEQWLTRCPYRDRHDRCTARVRCRAQLAVEPPAGGGVGDPRVLACTHDGRSDYRDAWEASPRA